MTKESWDFIDKETDVKTIILVILNVLRMLAWELNTLICSARFVFKSTQWEKKCKLAGKKTNYMLHFFADAIYMNLKLE